MVLLGVAKVVARWLLGVVMVLLGGCYGVCYGVAMVLIGGAMVVAMVLLCVLLGVARCCYWCC